MQADPKLDFPREWFSFYDPDDDDNEIRCDLTWLMSYWTCIYGSGCKGIFKERPNDGCCSQGAYFSDADDRRRVKAFADQLTAEDWQLKPEKRKGGIFELGDDGRKKTRVVDGGCIFLNRPDFEGGQGCALHRMALRIGKHPLETKPDVCWQLPIHHGSEWVERDDGHQVLVTTIGEFDRRGWGEGGHDLDWWCTSAKEAHTGRERLYITYGPELAAIIGLRAYRVLKEYCDERARIGMLREHPAAIASY